MNATVRYNECINCNHYPAYHDGDGGRICRAFVDHTPDLKCSCNGWGEKPYGERNDEERETKARAAKARAVNR